MVNDDFGDVYGLLMAVTGDGFSYAEMEQAVKNLKKELSLVEGVARVELWGVQPKVIYLEASETQLSQLGITDASILNTLQQQNMVVDAGSVDIQDVRARIAPSGEFLSPEDIADLAIHPSILDTILSMSPGKAIMRSDELIRIRDIGTVKRGYADPPPTMMRFNGKPALAISITNIAGANIVDVGKAVDARMDELTAELPVGLEVQQVHWMSDIVEAMGWRMGVLIGIDLVLTILGTFIVMAAMGIDLQRMSLGALVIALGMMVDNSIVVADGFVVRLRKGMDRKEAAIESAGGPAMPLLGATVVAVMAFYPIGGSPENTGEYCLSLMLVVGISLLVSWVISMTLTPIKCIDMLPDPKSDQQDTDEYGGKLFVMFRRFLEKAIRLRMLFMASMVGLLVMAFLGFGPVFKQYQQI
jgi:multidrug efflux pump subunit AcrB